MSKEKLEIYKISEEYIKYISNFDKPIAYNKNIKH